MFSLSFKIPRARFPPAGVFQSGFDFEFKETWKFEGGGIRYDVVGVYIVPGDAHVDRSIRMRHADQHIAAQSTLYIQVGKMPTTTKCRFHGTSPCTFRSLVAHKALIPVVCDRRCEPRKQIGKKVWTTSLIDSASFWSHYVDIGHLCAGHISGHNCWYANMITVYYLPWYTTGAWVLACGACFLLFAWKL